MEWLRQRSRPYLFSNTLAPVITVTTQTVLKMIDSRPELRKQLFENADFFRKEMTALGFSLAGAGHPIIPVMLGDAELAQKFASQMLKEDIYVIGFSFLLYLKVRHGYVHKCLQRIVGKMWNVQLRHLKKLDSNWG